MRLGIGAIFKNEYPYIIEWLAFHRLVGFDQFIIADNMSDDGSSELLIALHDAGLIKRIEYPSLGDKGPQVPAYNSMLKSMDGKVDLLAFIDADEFIVPAEGKSIRQYLKPLVADASVGAVAVNWAIYGSSGEQEYREAPVTQRFTQRARKDSGVNRHIKSFVKPSFCQYMINPHKVVLKKGDYVKANGERFQFSEHNEHGCSSSVDWSPMRINHYVIKSLDEFTHRKQKRGRATINERRKDNFFRNHDMNHESSHIMACFQDDLMQEMRSIDYQLNLKRYVKKVSKVHSVRQQISAKTGVIGRWLDNKPAFDLVPYSDIKATSGAFDWRSIGRDPAFMLKHKGAKLCGWYMVTLQVRSSLPVMRGKLFVNYGHGFSEQSSIELPLKSGKQLKRVCYFSKPVKSLRFDPVEEACEFGVEAMQFSRLTPAFSQKLMWKKVKARFPGMQFELTGDKLYRKYSSCFRYEGKPVTYDEWLKYYVEGEEVVPEGLSTTTQRVGNATFSLILNFIDADESVQAKAVDSILAQTYNHYEVILVLASGGRDRVSIIEKDFYCKGVRTVRICADCFNDRALNAASIVATGDYILVPDHQLVLSHSALQVLANKINSLPVNSSAILYADQDRIDCNGKRHTPYFKPEWNPDLLLSQDYISNFVAISRRLLGELGGFRSGIKGYELYDVILRATGQLTDDFIIRLPYVLSHYVSEDKGVLVAEPEVATAIKVRKDYLAERGVRDVITMGKHNNYRVKWPLPEQNPLVSLIIPTRDGYDILKRCIDSILKKTTYNAYEILIVDNQSTCPKTMAYLDELSHKNNVDILRYDSSFNYSAINNFAVEQAKGQLIGLINNDVEVISDDWLTEMVSHAIRPEIGCVGAMLYYGNDTIQHAGVICGLGGVAGHSHKHFKRGSAGFQNRLKCVQNLSAVTAAVMLVKKGVYCQVGGLDADNLKVAFNDVDFCLKVREAGYRNLWTPYAELYHHESVSRGLDDTPEKKVRFEQEHRFMKKKWENLLYPDPCYNPNLTQVREDFSFNG